ncbi:hypothetical protein [Mesorhizobium sp. B1-1-8]|uniref:hypothetical protein n=1 Tax=Mesorhizobium sp. B1-1-8 TaxID=2589976 RepID=UPI0015E40FF6|nr:hypothetical protein [Mesorhizobium sp. B1-1-8]UCI05080.1 hypothetical protein FJ974_14485 [Mesorhizobium sp. B1-1-8]
MRQSLGFSLAYFAFACSIAVACAGTAVAGQHGGGHDAGGQHGGGHDAGGHQGDDGDHDAGSRHGESGNHGQHKGSSSDPVGDSGSPPSNDPPSDDPPSNDPPSNDPGISTTPTAAIPSTPAATAAIVDPSADGGHSLDLPPALQPPEDSTIPPAVNPVEALPGVPDKVVRACHEAIEQAAAKFGAASVRVSSAGSIRRLSQRRISAPIQVSIDYVHQGRVETRQAPVGCELNAKGSVIGLT